MKKRILLIGSARADLDLRVPAFAPDGGELYGDFDCGIAPGGALSLAAVTLTRLGGEVILCGCVGDDQYGRDLIRFYTDLGMDTRFIQCRKGAKTPVCLTEDASNGSRRRYVSSALSDALGAEQVEEAFTSLPDAVYVSLDVAPAAAVCAAALAREKNLPAFFDGQYMAEDFPLADLGAVDLIALGADMTRRYTGIAPRDAQSNLEAAVALAKMLKAKTYLFKYGVGGAFAYKGNFSYYIPYVEDADARYNEIFVPAMILENLRSEKSVRAARYASAVIALASRNKTELIASVPGETEVLRYILEHEVEL